MFSENNQTLLGICIRDLQNRIVCRARLIEDNNLPAYSAVGEIGL